MPRERKTLDEHALQSTRPQYVLPDTDVVASRPKIPGEFKKKPELRSLFKKYCQALEKRRTLTSGDAELLRLVVLCRDRHARAIHHLQTEGEIVTYQRLDSCGQAVDVVKQNLWLKIAADSEKQIVSILDRLGLTPANRAKVRQATAPKPDTSKEDAMLSRDEARRQKEAADSAAEADAMLASVSDETLEGLQ
jgi:P27 family predicted phage terminase small subunit